MDTDAGRVVGALMLLPSAKARGRNTVLEVAFAMAQNAELPEWARSAAQGVVADVTARSDACRARVSRLSQAGHAAEEYEQDPELGAVLQSQRRPSCLRCENAWDGYHIGYRCYTCAKSEHSCICIDCFNAGDHEGHDYRLFQSQSGGCCDCGDAQAWDSNGFCCHHNPASSINMGALLPHAVQEAVQDILQAVVWVMVGSLQRITAQEDPAEESMEDARVLLDWCHEVAKLNDGYRVVVCDELLRPRAVPADALPPVGPPAGGLDMQTDDTGPPPVHPPTPGSRAAADGSGDDTSAERRPALQVLFESIGFDLEDELLEMLGFFYIKCLLHAPFKRAFTRQFVRSYSTMIDTMLPQIAQAQGQSPPVSKFLDLLSCQLFHDSDHVAQLVEEERLLHHLLTKLRRYMIVASDRRRMIVASDRPSPGGSRDTHGLATATADSGGTMGDDLSEPGAGNGLPAGSTQPSSGNGDRALYLVNCDERRVNEQLFMRLCADLRSIITHRRIAGRVIEDPSLLQLLLQIFSSLQSANAHTRQVAQHVEYESRGWQYAFILEFEIIGVLKPILHAFGERIETETASHGGEDVQSATASALSRAILLGCASELQLWRSSREASCLAAADSGTDELVQLNVPLRELDLGRFCVSGDPVSFHLTVHRLATAVAFESLYRRRNEAEADLRELWCLDELPQSFMCFLVDHPLRVLVLCSQIESNRWVRNGSFAMAHQVTLYRNRLWHDMGAELDLLLMQCGAQLLGNAFVALALQRFELAQFFRVGSESDLDGEQASLAFTAADADIAQDFLQLMVSIGRDRTRCGLSKACALRRELVVWLAVSDSSFSQLLDKLSHWTSSNAEEVESALRLVADYHEPTQTDDSGFYRLKEEQWDNVDTMFLRLDRASRVKLEENFGSRPWPACMRTLDTESLWPAFQALPHRVFQSCVLHRIVFATCWKVHHCKGTAELPSMMPIFQLCLQVLLYAAQTCPPDAPEQAVDIPDAISTSSLGVLGDFCVDHTFSNLLVTAPEVGGGRSLLALLFELSQCEELPRGDSCLTVDVLLDELCSRSAICAESIATWRAETSEVVNTSPLTPNRKRQAQERQAALLAQFAQQQQSFSGLMDLSSSDDEDEDQQGGQDVAQRGEANVKTDVPTVDMASMECVLCRAQSDSPMCHIVTMQRSCLMRTQPASGSDGAVAMVEGDAIQPDQCQLHVQSCGHTAHLQCLHAYAATWSTRGAGAETQSIDWASGEFACPVCRRLSNAALPIVQPWQEGAAQLSAQEEAALREFLARAIQEKGLASSDAPPRSVAEGIVEDSAVLLDCFAAELLPHDTEWMTSAQRECLCGLLRALCRVIPPSPGQPVPLPNVSVPRLLPQFISTMFSAPALHSSLSATLESVQTYYKAAVIQAVFALLPRLSPDLVSRCRLIERVFTGVNGTGEIRTGSAEPTQPPIQDDEELVAEVTNLVVPLLREMLLLTHSRFLDAMPLPALPTPPALLDALRLAPVEDVLRVPDRFEETISAICAASRPADAEAPEQAADTLCALPAAMPTPALFRMAELPDVYVDLLLEHQGSCCTACGAVPKEPALCLVCGALLCFKHSSGLGECTAHAAHCCGSVGAFLVLRACAVVLLMGSGRQCVWGSLYLDAHGEKDAYLQRGKTLYLQARKQLLLRRSLVQHSLLTDTLLGSRTTRHAGGHPA